MGKESIKNNLKARQRDFEELDMLGLSDAELKKIMTDEEIKEMKEYLREKKSK